MKIDVKYIAERSWELISSPAQTWDTIASENKTAKEVRTSYVFPWILACILLVFATQLLYARADIFQRALLESIITAISFFCGYYAAVKVCFWYLKTQLAVEADENRCEVIVAYSFTTIFFLKAFISIFPGLFFLTILSIHCAYLLWEGFRAVVPVEENDRGNIVIVFSVAIILIPFVISKLVHLMLPNA